MATTQTLLVNLKIITHHQSVPPELWSNCFVALVAADLPNGRATRRSAPIYLNVLSPASYRSSPGPDLDDVFGPVDSPRVSEDVLSPRWVTFVEDRPPPPDEPAPPPPPDSPPPDTPSSTPSTPPLSPGPPPNEPPPSPPPFSPGSPPPPFTPPDSPPSIVLGPPPPVEPAPPLPPDFSRSHSPPACLEEEAIDEEVLQFAEYCSSPVPISPVPPLPAERRSPRAGIISPLVLGGAGGKRTPDGAYLRDDISDYVGSPRELTPSFRGTPPPLPPTTYRSIMSSPGPYSGSSEYPPLNVQLSYQRVTQTFLEFRLTPATFGLKVIRSSYTMHNSVPLISCSSWYNNKLTLWDTVWPFDIISLWIHLFNDSWVVIYANKIRSLIIITYVTNQYLNWS